MDEVLKRDENHITVAAAVTNDADLDIVMLRVDPITKELLVDISTPPSVGAFGGQVAKRDQNHVPVCLGYNEEDDELQEILVDENGYLLCDVI